MASRPTEIRTTSTAAAQPAGGGAAARRRALLAAVSPRYILCLALLLGSAAGLQLFANLTGVHFRKEPVPLKQPLTLFDFSRLEPQYVRYHRLPPPLNEEMVQKLGTHQYGHFLLEDVTRSRSDPTRLANVFLTYYTGQPNMVPHVPEECYVAGDYDQMGPTEEVELHVPGCGAEKDLIPVRVLQFQARSGKEQLRTVLYFFHVNGKYLTTRDSVRLVSSNPWETHAYYAKIEITFSDDLEGVGQSGFAGKRESLQAAEPLLQKLMPVLLEDHFAWDQVHEAAAATGGEG